MYINIIWLCFDQIKMFSALMIQLLDKIWKLYYSSYLVLKCIVKYFQSLLMVYDIIYIYIITCWLIKCV